MKTSIRTHDGRVALVTGAGQGIGQAIALALAKRGDRVIATDLQPPHETARMIGPEAYAMQLECDAGRALAFAGWQGTRCRRGGYCCE
jgi:NAD(P)-dependent dehydrogenase (short-subunit alcohol dehydrogenase family)